MAEYELSSHAKDMLNERNILEEWLWQTLHNPDDQIIGADNNLHYMKAISQRDGRILRVIINPHTQPKRVVTLFFDRRLRRNK